MHLALQAVAGTDVPLGVIPVGTGNDNARCSGSRCDDPAAAADVVADCHVAHRRRGHGRTADGDARGSSGVLSSGFDSAVNERANAMTWPKGQARYLVAILAELRTFQPGAVHVVVVDGRGVTEHEGMLVAVGNGIVVRRRHEGLPRRAASTTGCSTVTVPATSSARPTFLRVFPSVYKGTHVDHPSVHRARGHDGAASRRRRRWPTPTASGSARCPVDVRACTPARSRVLHPRAG